MIKNYCYATLVTNEKYIKGANLLYQYLQQYESKYPLIVMISDTIDSNELYGRTEIIPDIHFQINDTEYLKKFYCLNLKYDKVIFLDADLIPKENFDYMFEECCGPISYGVRDIENQDFYPHGGIIYFEPNNYLLDKIMQKDKEYLFTNDEDLLNRYFNNNIFTFIPYFYHMGGELKYWESKYFKKEIIYNKQIFFKFLEDFNEKRE